VNHFFGSAFGKYQIHLVIGLSVSPSDATHLMSTYLACRGLREGGRVFGAINIVCLHQRRWLTCPYTKDITFANKTVDLYFFSGGGVKSNTVG